MRGAQKKWETRTERKQAYVRDPSLKCSCNLPGTLKRPTAVVTVSYRPVGSDAPFVSFNVIPSSYGGIGDIEDLVDAYEEKRR